MGKLKLYGVELSPPVRAVKLTLAALGLPYDFVILDILTAEHLSEQSLKRNPQHTVPVLEDGDLCFWDSHAIMAYLVSKYGKNDSLYPKDLAKRAVVDQRLHFESGVVFANSLRTMSKLVFLEQVKELPRERIDAIVEVYEFVETFLSKHDYIAGDNLTIADFSLISSISSLVGFLEIDSAKYVKLSAWIKRMEQLPYYGENAFGAGLLISLLRRRKLTVSKL